MKIVVLDGFTLNPGDLDWSGFAAMGDITVYDRTPEDQTVARIGDAEIVLTNKVVLSDSIFEACPKIKYIGVLATGYNVVDLEAANKRGILVTNIPTYGTDAVAQFVIALLLEICHHIGDHSSSVYQGDWSSCQDFCYWNYPLIELAGKTMGIIGYGRIGQKTGQIAQALGMNVLAYDKFQIKDLENDQMKYVSLEDIYAKSDIISLHCPALPDTIDMINKTSIGQMKDGVILLNNSRGQLIVEQDLADALNSGKVYAAGLDVVSSEPIKPDNPLLQAKNCLITPHISWAPKESRQRLMDIAVNNLKSFLDGQPVNVVK